MLRTLALMVLVYLMLGWMVERYSSKPDSQVKAFFRVLISPVTRPIAARMKAGPFDRRVVAAALFLTAATFIALAVIVRVLTAFIAA